MSEKNLCINCGKCVNGCPAQINIPKYLNAYYNAVSVDDIQSSGNPLDCIECGYCSLCCPQKIKVLAIIRKMAMEECRSHSGR